jgi:TPP-dependent 2-oxoacid decarboxylase
MWVSIKWWPAVMQNLIRQKATLRRVVLVRWVLPCQRLLAAKFGAPNRTVVAIIGDGGFQMTIQELGTVMQSGIDIKIIILNNNFLGMVRQWQQLFHEKRYSFVDITSP